MSKRLDFGLVLSMVSHDATAHEFAQELVEESLTAESVGLDFCLVPEHHQGPDNALPHALTVAGWLLAKTNTIRIGTGIMVLPLYDPVLVAEQTAILQEASGNRLILGVGAGYQGPDFNLFEVNPALRGRRLEDHVRLLRDAWSGGQIRSQKVIPRVETPPAIWFGGSATAAIDRAAKLGDGWLTNPLFTVDEIATSIAEYRKYASLANRPSKVIVLREFFVADSDEVAEELYGPAFEQVFRYYFKAGALGHFPNMSLEDVHFDGVLSDLIICGSPDTVVTKTVALLEQTGADGIAFMMRHPSGPSHGDVCHAIELLGLEVIPAVRALVKDGS